MEKTKKLKRIFLLLFSVLILCSCGADINYNIDVDTEKQLTNIEILLNVTESDYEHIEGGKEKLLSIINEKKPGELDFIYNAEDANKYIFKLSFSSYDEYLDKFEAITKEKSKSKFDVEKYSSQSPFIEYQDIVIEDDYSKLLDWLKNDLIDSKTISDENKDKLINNESYTYKFNEENNYSGTYNNKELVNIQKPELKLIVKKSNKADITLSFVVSNSYKDFQDDFSTYLKNKKITSNYKYNYVKQSKDKSKLYKLEINDLDLKDKKEIKQLNNVLGNEFIKLTSIVEEEDTFFDTKIYQELQLEVNPKNLFDRDADDRIDMILDVDEVEINNDFIEMPYKVEKLNSIHFENIKTTYSEFKVHILVLTILIVLILLVVIVIFVKRTGKKNIQNMSNKYNNVVINRVIEILDKPFSKSYEISNNIIEGNQFSINILSIDKISYRRKYDCQKNLVYVIKAIAIVIVFIYLNWLFMAIIIALVIVFYLAVLYVERDKKVLNIKLISGNEYSFIFENNDLLLQKFNELLYILDKKEDEDDNDTSQLLGEDK